MKDNTEYREALEEAVKGLQHAETAIFTALVNVGFKGPYKDISDMHEPGEVLNLELSMFEDTTDANLEALVALVKNVNAVRHQLVHLNSLDIDVDEE